ncbi:HIPL1 protein-like protein [Carex littledalei]|uniref:HIPL1 protein-like protein n=1 Tax=Carex littledalei TaxID=544730 RepID=A0A833QY37_9POAL|nr:HIPL1 protein-like protein [Carex littledalei]
MSLFVLLLSLFLLQSCYSAPMCMDQTFPKKLNSSLEFCGYSDKACCSAADDLAIQDLFTQMNISDAACSGVMKSILCSQCSPYAFDLYSKSQNYPVLCNNKLVASLPPTNSTTDFCTQTWNSCKDIDIRNSPFANSSNPSNKLSDSYRNVADFCKAAGSSATDKSICFNGGVSVGFNGTQAGPPPQGICLERLFNGSYMNIEPHPDGSNRVFLATQAGKIFLANVPPQGSGKMLDIDLTNPFIDLTDVVHFDNEFGLNGFTFHPKFATNGRFFVAYNCDKSKSATCSGKCSCNSEINCDPSKLGTNNGALPCQYQSVIAEYTVNGSSASPNNVTNANPAEVARVFTMGLPYKTHHAGEIFFGPTDGYLYYAMGDGGNAGDPWNFAQNKKSVLGKILRLNVDLPPTQDMIDNLTLWGIYSIPKDNPYFTDRTFRPEVYSYGLRNPWRCSYDAERPTYIFCGDTAENAYEEINLMQKGGNYGWRVYQGYDLYSSPWAPGPNISANSIDPIFPVLGYNRSEVNNNLGSAAIVAGYVYRGKTDPCLYGRYIYGDLYANNMFTAVETPIGSANFTRDSINFTCTKNSPIPCDFTGKSSLPSLGYIFSFGQDNNKDLYYLTSKGVYRVVRPSLCGYSCPLETLLSAQPPSSKDTSLGLKLETHFGLVLTCLLILLGLRF